MDLDKVNNDFEAWYKDFLNTEFKNAISGWTQKEIAQAAWVGRVKFDQSTKVELSNEPVPVAWLHPTDPTRAITNAQKDGGIKDGGGIAKSMSFYSVPAYLVPLPGPSGELHTEPAAWLHPEDPMRVITKAQKDGALKDGGGIKTAMQACTIACYTKTKIDYME